jgi:hypothetical protein
MVNSPGLALGFLPIDTLKGFKNIAEFLLLNFLYFPQEVFQLKK